MRRAVPVAVVALVVLLAACSGSSDDGAPSLRTSPPTTPGEATTTSSPPESTTTTGVSPGPERCSTSNLRLAYLESRAALGHGLAVFEVRNTSSRPCRLSGYPGVALLDASGRALAQAQRGPGYILGDRPPAPVTIAPGGAAYLGIESLNACVAGDPEAESDRIQVIPPDETEPVVVAATITVCPRPEIVVSPIRATQAELAA